MKLDIFDYYLPTELIAQTPLKKRDSSRLLALDKHTGEIRHGVFSDIKAYLKPGDCLVLNNTRVIPARLYGTRNNGGEAEFLLLNRIDDVTWETIVRPGRRLKVGARVTFGDGRLVAEVQEVKDDGNRIVKFEFDGI